MRKVMNFLLSFAFIAVTSLLLSCEGPTGPAGPAGSNGTNGVNGLDGIDGTNGTATCSECHHGQEIASKEAQYNSSVHATGVTEDGRNTCAPCHTSQGYLEVLGTTNTQTAATIMDPLPTNCYTCHDIHNTYSADDWKLNKTDLVTLRINNTATVNFGKANLCATCHQPRLPSPLPVVGGDSISVTSNRFGPHHACQASILGGTGKGAYEVPGDLAYSNSSHTAMVTDGCVTCHMAPTTNNMAGGHTFAAASENEETGAKTILTSGCVACHSDAAALTTLITNKEAEIATLVDSLKSTLIAKNILNATTGLIIAGTTSSPKRYSADQAGAYINFVMINEDMGAAIHNFNYAKALLTNSIAALN